MHHSPGVKVQFRTVQNDACVSEWIDWEELGTFESLEKAIANIKTTFKHDLEDVSFDQIGVYELIDFNPRCWQFRFPKTQHRENPWKIGLNETEKEDATVYQKGQDV